ncbi:hypothetical protein ACFXDE_26165 [Kitasatospora sp. NPDC059408]|uniref:hypothetical protein n=1 Tax=Kitasatospora sp. NPDC059408 TaxID=3346823 RepID=UPI00368BC0DB
MRASAEAAARRRHRDAYSRGDCAPSDTSPRPRPAGVKSAVAHPGAPITLPQAGALAGGIALYLVVNTAVRRTFRLTPNAPRLVAAALLLATVRLGTTVSALAQVAATATVLAAAFTYEARRSPVADFPRD